MVHTGRSTELGTRAASHSSRTAVNTFLRLGLNLHLSPLPRLAGFWREAFVDQ